MPIYQYRCKNPQCGMEIEALQKMSDQPLVECEHCHQMSLEKVVTAAAVRLNGKGYYETDEKPQAKQRHVASSDSASSSS